MPCRGTGKVISNLGGSASRVSCPWCRGTGVRVPGIDAQAHWGGDESGDAVAGSSGAGAGAGEPADDTAAQ
jgi:hypothetical protein